MTCDVEAIRASVYAAQACVLTDTCLAVLRVTQGWEKRAQAEFGDTSLSGSAQKAYQVWEAMEAVLGGDRASSRDGIGER